jgi:hypothetical protein
MFFSLLLRSDQLRHREEHDQQEYSIFKVARSGVRNEIQNEHLGEFIGCDVFKDGRLFNETRRTIHTVKHNQETVHERRVKKFIIHFRKVIKPFVRDQTIHRHNQERGNENIVIEHGHL